MRYALFFIQLFAVKFKNWKWFILFVYIVNYDLRLICNAMSVIIYK